jgi:NAD(P)-dependent dehydrogenase (short-subunit alcohol dehydrogenase family)
MRLQGKTAVITGGTSGIGLATARQFIAQGAQVLITGQDPARLAAAGRELGSLTQRVDVRQVADLEALAASAKARLGHIDILFANAGVAFVTPLPETGVERFDEIFSTNVKGVFFTVQALVPLMPAGASIVLNTSWLDEVGTPGLSLLSASKAAVRSLTRTLAAELLAQGVRVNAVSPGAIATPIHAKSGMSPDALQAFADQVTQRIPLKRFGEADEVAAAVLFLAGNESRSMLGAELVVDGGFSQL